MSIVEENDIGSKYSAVAIIISSWFDDSINGKAPEIQKGILNSGKKILENALGIFDLENPNTKNGAYFLFVMDALQNATGKIYDDFKESEQDIRTCRELLDFPLINQQNKKNYKLSRDMWEELHRISCENRVNQYFTGEKSSYAYVN
ncbi:MAG: hypothetical protein PVJ67_02160 [Candidatus Pacearchaeota archaeon]|jgi:hypothetical protein